jgi:hypothetical protein
MTPGWGGSQTPKQSPGPHKLRYSSARARNDHFRLKGSFNIMRSVQFIVRCTTDRLVADTPCAKQKEREDEDVRRVSQR